MTRDPVAPVAIGLIASAGQLMAGALATTLLARGVTCSLADGDSDELAAILAAGNLDVALHDQNLDGEQFHSEPAVQKALGLACHRSDGAGAAGAVSLQDALRQPLAMPPRTSWLRRRLAAEAKAEDITLEIVTETTSRTLITGLVSEGVAAAIVPITAFHREAEAGRLALRPIAGPPLLHTLYLTVSRRSADRRPVITAQEAMRVLIADLVQRGDIGWSHCAVGDTDQPTSSQPMDA